MRWTDFKSKLLLKYTLSYIAIFLIPLIVLTVFIYHNAVNTLRSEIEQTNVNQMTQAKRVIDERMKELQDIASRIAYDELLTRYWVSHPYYSLESIAALSKYKAASSIMDELILFFRGDEKIYSTQGLENLEVFTRRYKFDSWNKDELIRDLNTVKFPTIRPAELVGKETQTMQPMLAYLVPITPNHPSPHGTVMYLIHESNLTGLIDSILGDYDGMTYIFDNNGQVLASSLHGYTVSNEDIAALYSLAPGTHSLSLNHTPHSVVSVRSEAGWTYVTAMPSSQFFSRIVPIQGFIMLVFSLVVIVGTLFAVMLARKQYHPISDLMDFVRLTDTAGTLSSGNELECIKKTLHTYSQRVDLQEPYARNHLLLNMLKYGHAGDLSLELQESLGIRFNRTHYFAACMAMELHMAQVPDQPERSNPPGHPVPSKQSALLQLFNDIDIPELNAHIYAVELPQPDRLALIIGFDIPGGPAAPLPEKVEAVVEALHAKAAELTGILPAVGAGKPYSHPGQLNQSYIEASTAIEASMLHSPGSVTFFDKLSGSEASSFWVPKDVLLKLVQSLKQGSFEVASQMVSTALDNLRTEKPAVPLMRCICFDILNTILKTASELGLQDITKQAAHFTSFRSLEDLEGRLTGLIAEICRQVESRSETEESSLIDRILPFIDEHYSDHQLSLDTISSTFSISPSYFSRSFKEKLGVNFSQYIWQKRMDEVMRLLLQTDEPLKEIITRVGYLDTPNFIRKFKKETGLTPGQYRKMNRPAGAPSAAADEDEECTGT